MWKTDAICLASSRKNASPVAAAVPKRGAWCEEWKAGALMPEGAEKYDDFIERALRGINQALAYPGPVLIVSHEMVYHALRPYTGLGPDYILPHCRVVRHDPPVVAGQKWQVITL